MQVKITVLEVAAVRRVVEGIPLPPVALELKVM
jgi:hypothetical protein